MHKKIMLFAPVTFDRASVKHCFAEQEKEVK